MSELRKNVSVTGFKGFKSDMTCRGMQYEIGKTYSMDEPPILCGRGYHFCKTLRGCFDYYSPFNNAVFCEVTASGVIDTDDFKCVTNRIIIGARVNPVTVFRAFYGDGYYGNGYGYYGNGYYGDGYGNGYGDGDGGYGYGNGYGDGDGGYGDGDGDYCNGYGDGFGLNIQKILIYKE